MKTLLALFTAAGLAFAALPAPALAQTAPPKPGLASAPRVYTYVQQMPQLPGGGGNLAIIAAIERLVAQTSPRLAKTTRGKVLTTFTIGPDGMVKDGFIDTGLGTGPDEAVLVALGRLPRFWPGKQDNQRVGVRMTLPITFPIAAPAPSKTL